MDREALKRRLLEERERLQREIADLDAELSESLEDSAEESPYDQHMAEIADVTLDREIDLTLEENALATITQIDRALEKLENGTRVEAIDLRFGSPASPGFFARARVDSNGKVIESSFHFR